MESWWWLVVVDQWGEGGLRDSERDLVVGLSDSLLIYYRDFTGIL